MNHLSHVVSHEDEEKLEHRITTVGNVIDEHHEKRQQHSKAGHGGVKRRDVFRTAPSHLAPDEGVGSTDDEREHGADDDGGQEPVEKPYLHHNQTGHSQSGRDKNGLSDIGET